MPIAKHTTAEKLAILEALRKSGERVGIFAQAHGVDPHTMWDWQALYERDGFAGLAEARKNQHYSQGLSWRRLPRT